MSTSEKWTNTYSPCPCGAGSILQHVDSPDNPWSTVGYTYELSCPKCQQNWILDIDKLHDRSAYEAERQAFRELQKYERQLDAIGADSIDKIVEATQFPDYKSEYRALKDAGLCLEGPIRYKRFRESGQSASSMCRPRHNLPWIVAQLTERSVKEKIEELELERAQHESDFKTHANCITISIRSLKNSN